MNGNEGINIEKIYERLERYYSMWSSYPILMLEQRIRKLQRRGLTREEAILVLYKKIYGGGLEEEYTITPEGGYAISKRQYMIGFMDLLSYAYNMYTCNPILILPAILMDSVMYIGNSILLMFILWMLNEILRRGIYLGEGAIRMVILKVLELVRENVLISVLVIIAYIILYIVAVSLYWLSLIKASLKAYKGLRLGVGDMLFNFRTFLRVLRGQLLVYGILAVPLVIPVMMIFKVPTSIFFLLFVIFISLISLLMLYMLLVFVPHEIIVKGTSSFSAICGSFRVVIASLKHVLVYILMMVLASLGASMVSHILSMAHILLSEFIFFVITCFINPIFNLSITGVYIQAIGHDITLWREQRPIISVILYNVRRGIRKLREFLENPCNLIFISMSVVLLICSYIYGVQLGTTYLSPLTTRLFERGRLSPILYEYIPLSIVLEILFNNWKIALVTAVGGLFFAVPVVATITNGLFIGLVASRMGLLEFIVLITPHGCIELPAFIIAIASGLRLSYFLLFRRDELEAKVRETILIAIGLIIPLLIAAIIEVSITPWIARVVLGWK
ncbi:MAG: hypothetical protein DRN53_02265 [Thermoprotei archaeon]|nr:MAG: hypothetical protein DRN53_02265 [Thermoprotei archaeon]